MFEEEDCLEAYMNRLRMEVACKGGDPDDPDELDRQDMEDTVNDALKEAWGLHVY